MNPRKMRKYGMRGFKNINRNAAKRNKQLEQRVKELEDMVCILIHTVADLCEDMMEGE